jgi:hypothetical protein
VDLSVSHELIAQGLGRRQRVVPEERDDLGEATITIL